jgi:hypothetical protein
MLAIVRTPAYIVSEQTLKQTGRQQLEGRQQQQGHEHLVGTGIPPDGYSNIFLFQSDNYRNINSTLSDLPGKRT